MLGIGPNQLNVTCGPKVRIVDQQRRGLTRGAGDGQDEPVTMPPSAVGTTTVMIDRQRSTPSASEASRREAGTRQQHLLGRARHQRQHDDGQRHRSGEAGVLVQRLR